MSDGERDGWGHPDGGETNSSEFESGEWREIAPGRESVPFRTYSLDRGERVPPEQADPASTVTDQVLRYALEVGLIFIEFSQVNRRCLKVRTCNRELQAEVRYFEMPSASALVRLKALAGLQATQDDEEVPARSILTLTLGPIRRRAEVRCHTLHSGEVLKLFLFDR
jgi:hypothetical protein